VKRTSIHLTLIAVASTILLATTGCIPSSAADENQDALKAVTIDGDHLSRVVSVIKGALVEVKLMASFGSGFSWRLEPPVDGGALQFIGTRNEDLSTTPAGTTGGPNLQIFSFQAVAEGTTTLVFNYVRPWLRSEPPRDIRRISVTVTPET
jgi:predicted secreted protein